MREIKFRGKRTDNGEWVYGGYAYCAKDDTHWIAVIGVDHISHIGRHKQVDPATVGQFTGLRDKNGKEIYEGDVVQDPDGVLYRVQWQPFSASWEIEGKEHFFLFVMRAMDLFGVIGNIHDNPELLKEVTK